MLIQKEVSDKKISIKGYTPGAINIMGKNYSKPVVLTADNLIEFTQVEEFALLQAEHLQALVQPGMELLLVGSGENHSFIPPAETKELLTKGIAVESMSTRNACHTFQVLIHENRKVVALLFP